MSLWEWDLDNEPTALAAPETFQDEEGLRYRPDQLRGEDGRWVSELRMSKPGRYFHVAHTRSRQAIRNEGLRLDVPRRYTNDPVPGNYVFENFESAWRYMVTGERMHADQDVWIVEGTGLTFEPDPYFQEGHPLFERIQGQFAGLETGAAVTRQPIGPDRMTLAYANPWFPDEPQEFRYRPDQARANDGRWVDEPDQVETPIRPGRGKPGTPDQEWEEAIMAWTGGGNYIEEMRADPSLPEAQEMRRRLAEAPWKTPTLKLYRGMYATEEESYKLLSNLKPGDVLKTDLAVSFSKREDWVQRQFLGPEIDADTIAENGLDGEPGDWTGVMLELEGGPVVSVKEWSNTPGEEEWIIGRDLEVATVTKVHADAWRVKVRPVKTEAELNG